MALKLGKSFDRSYNLRVPFMDAYYNIGIYFDRKSTFLLFRVDPDVVHGSFEHNVKINMFKNLESSKFCETFINLHNYKKNTLDIVNQFERVKDDYIHEISFILNETRLGKKIVRTSGIQIATNPALSMLDEYLEESKVAGKEGLEPMRTTDKIIKLSEAEQEAISDGTK
jgi:hypothetical protein